MHVLIIGGIYAILGIEKIPFLVVEYFIEFRLEFCELLRDGFLFAGWL